MCGMRTITWQTFERIEWAYRANHLITMEGIALNNQQEAWAVKDLRKEDVLGSRLREILRQIAESPAHSIVQLSTRDKAYSLSVHPRFTPQSLLSAIVHFHTSECSEPRDKVYALLGLTHDGLPKYDFAGNLVSGIEVDYAKEPLEVLGDCLRTWDTTMTEDQRWHSNYATLLRKAMGIPLDSTPSQMRPSLEKTCASALETERERKTARRGKRRKVKSLRRKNSMCARTYGST
jgi:hypothetical protein